MGRSFQRFALQATILGIRNAHINQPIEVPFVRPEFARWLGAADVAAPSGRSGVDLGVEQPAHRIGQPCGQPPDDQRFKS